MEQEIRRVPKSPPAPGAATSPQRPGQTPDHSSIPGQMVDPPPTAPTPIVRPLTEYGTAQQVMNLMPAPNEEAKPADFEQPKSSFQELRKAYPWQVPPVRPTASFALDQGTSTEPPVLTSGELDAIESSSGGEA